MWSHVFILVGHGTMMAGWWLWYARGYAGVAETLRALGGRGRSVRRAVEAPRCSGWRSPGSIAAREIPMRYVPSPIEQAYRAGKAAGDDDAGRAHYQRGIDARARRARADARSARCAALALRQSRRARR